MNTPATPAHVPAGFHTVSPSLTCRDASAALDFYRRAFDAVEFFRLAEPQTGKVMHAEMRIGDSVLMLSDEYPEWDCVMPEFRKGGSFMIYVADADAAMAQAVAAGATEIMPAADQFYGDRVGRVACPYGYRWSLAQRVKEVSKEEMDRIIAEGKM